MQTSSVSVRGLSTTRPASFAPMPHTPGVATIRMPGASPQLYRVPATAKPRTVKVLVAHALERLAPFGIPDLASWNIEILETDGDDYQVNFTNEKGATLCVDAISMTANKCGVSYDFGISASVD